MVGYDEPEIAWYLEYGFPLGLQEDPPPVLVPAISNHGSSYQFYTFIDKFLKTGIKKCDLVGPFKASPFENIHVSPLMTAPKKPSSRRPVFDATFGDHSLNNNTPSDHYLGQPMEYAYPRIEDFKSLVLEMLHLETRFISFLFANSTLSCGIPEGNVCLAASSLFLCWSHVRIEEQWVPGPAGDQCCDLDTPASGFGNR